MTKTIFLFLALCTAWALTSAQTANQPPNAARAEPFALSPATPLVGLDNRSAYWIDNDRSVTIDKLEAASDTLTWAVRKPNAHYNLDGKALWVQFDANTLGVPNWYVEVDSSGIDRVQFFYRDTAGQWVTQEAGDTRSVSSWPLPGRFPTFELSPSSHTVRYWLRIEHNRVNFGANIAVRSLSSLTTSRENEQFLLGAYFGLAALIFLVSVANAVATADRNFAVYALYVISLAAGQMAYLGVGAQHVWPHALAWNEIATFLLPGLSAAAGLWFVRTATEPARFSRWLDLGVWAMLAALLSAVAMDTYLQTRASFTLVMVLTICVLVLICALIAKVWREDNDVFNRYLALGFLPVIVMALFPLARGLNLIPNSMWTRYGMSIGAALEMPILFYAMTLRSTRRREARWRTASLTHNDPLTGVAHRPAFELRLDNAIARAKGQHHQCGAMVVHFTNHQAIADEYGRDAADRALVLTAARLRQVVTDMDLVARIDEHHFALLLEGPTLDATVQACATRVVASGLRISKALPGDITLKLHVAHSMLPVDNVGAASCLQQLQDATIQMGADARKAIRYLTLSTTPA